MPKFGGAAQFQPWLSAAADYGLVGYLVARDVATPISETVTLACTAVQGSGTYTVPHGALELHSIEQDTWVAVTEWGGAVIGGVTNDDFDLAVVAQASGTTLITFARHNETLVTTTDESDALVVPITVPGLYRVTTRVRVTTVTNTDIESITPYATFVDTNAGEHTQEDLINSGLAMPSYRVSIAQSALTSVDATDAGFDLTWVSLLDCAEGELVTGLLCAVENGGAIKTAGNVDLFIVVERLVSE
jgi:hypothetical protein